MSTIKKSDNDLASIREELNELRQIVAGLRSNGHHNGNGTSLLEANAATDRRGMLKTVAGLAVGVATVGLLRPANAKAAPRIGGKGPDNTGDNFITGAGNFVSAA